MTNIYKIIWFTYPNYFKVFYTVNDRKGFYYESESVNDEMQMFMEQANMNVTDFQVEWNEK